MTLYVILQLTEEGLWQFYGEQNASSPKRALDARDAEPGVYVAVAKRRSWKPLNVVLEETPRRTITPA
jgi:hypothetical protein